MSTANAVGCFGFGTSEGGLNRDGLGHVSVKSASDKDIVGKTSCLYVCVMYLPTGMFLLFSDPICT